MAKISRKQLKKDRFAEEVRHSVSYVSTHRSSMIAAAAALVVLTGGIYGYVTYRRAADADARHAFQASMNMFHGVVDTEERMGSVTFPSTIQKYAQTTEALEKVSGEFAGRSEEGAALYYLALLEIEQGKQTEARERLENVVESGDEEFSALARLVLADLLARRKENGQAREHLEYLTEHPTRLVPKERAQLELGRFLVEVDPEKAAEILNELIGQSGPAAAAANQALLTIEGS